MVLLIHCVYMHTIHTTYIVRHKMRISGQCGPCYIWTKRYCFYFNKMCCRKHAFYKYLSFERNDTVSILIKCVVENMRFINTFQHICIVGFCLNVQRSVLDVVYIVPTICQSYTYYRRCIVFANDSNYLRKPYMFAQ